MRARFKVRIEGQTKAGPVRRTAVVWANGSNHGILEGQIKRKATLWAKKLGVRASSLLIAIATWDGWPYAYKMAAKWLPAHRPAEWMQRNVTKVALI